MIQISIILPSYNPQNYIYDCIRSICNQTLDASSFELIIILNGDKEPYFTDINRYILTIREGRGIKVCYTELPGVSNARNIGLDMACGEYFCFVDDDDILSSNYLEELLLVSSPTCIGLSAVKGFYSSCKEANDDFFLSKYYLNRNNKKHTLYNFRGYFSIPWAKMIHRSIIGSHRYDTRFANGEDSLFITGLCVNIDSFKFATDAAYYVRIRKGSASRRCINVSVLLKSLIIQEWEYLKLLIKNRKLKNILFFISRFVGILKSTIIVFINRKSYK